MDAFTLCGGRFYLDWILPTNPTSRNPLIRLAWSWAPKPPYSDFAERRLDFAFTAGALHAVVGVIWAIGLPPTAVNFALNGLMNVYPVIVQIHIGLRCQRVVMRRAKRVEVDYE